MNEIQVLEGIMKKQKRGEGKADNKAAVEALMSIKSKNNDVNELAEYLVCLHYSVSQNFILEYSDIASSDEVKNLTVALLEEQNMKSNNPALFLFPKGLSAVYALTAKKHYATAYMAINQILAKAEGKKGFAASTISLYRKIFPEPHDSFGLVELYNQVDSGKIKSDRGDKERFAKFLRTVKVLDTKKAKTEEIISDLPKEDTTVRFVEQVNEVGYNVLSNIEKTQNEMLSMIKELMAKSDVIDKDSEINDLKKQVSDLTERLRVTLQMDDNNKNQELITLKNDIANGLKLDFADYEKSREKSHSKDLFKVYRAMLSRIFKQLKRFGIDLE